MQSWPLERSAGAGRSVAKAEPRKQRPQQLFSLSLSLSYLLAESQPAH